MEETAIPSKAAAFTVNRHSDVVAAALSNRFQILSRAEFLQGASRMKDSVALDLRDIRDPGKKFLCQKLANIEDLKAIKERPKSGRERIGCGRENKLSGAGRSIADDGILSSFTGFMEGSNGSFHSNSPSFRKAFAGEGLATAQSRQTLGITDRVTRHGQNIHKGLGHTHFRGLTFDSSEGSGQAGCKVNDFPRFPWHGSSEPRQLLNGSIPTGKISGY
jgi:hypothetical protein